MEILWKYMYYSLAKHNTVSHSGLQCFSLLTCLGELPHPGQVVHVAVTHQRVGGEVELRRDLEGGVGGQGGQVDRHQLVAVQPGKQQTS